MTSRYTEYNELFYCHNNVRGQLDNKYLFSIILFFVYGIILFCVIITLPLQFKQLRFMFTIQAMAFYDTLILKLRSISTYV